MLGSGRWLSIPFNSQQGRNGTEASFPKLAPTHIQRARILWKEPEPWSAIILSVPKGTVIEGRATDELLKDCVHQY